MKETSPHAKFFFFFPNQLSVQKNKEKQNNRERHMCPGAAQLLPRKKNEKEKPQKTSMGSPKDPTEF